MLRIAFLFTCITTVSLAQTTDSTTVNELAEVAVTAYATGRSVVEIAAPVSQITPAALRRFDNTTLLPAFNAQPGVRMEERSPGSYRLSIRGSSLRSPFGVRNVKVYWNHIPLSDANGITYLNLLDMSTIGSAEIIKGPAGSMYGAATGGVVLLKSRPAEQQLPVGLRVGMLGGAFGTFNANAAYTVANEKVNSVLTFAHVQADGYREHTNLRRDVLNWRSGFFYDAGKTLNVNLLYANIDYQTPGGLTVQQLQENPRQARPATRFTPGAVEQQAAIRQQLLTTGISHELKIGTKSEWAVSVFGTMGHLENPFITNYEIRDEMTAGGRTQLNRRDLIFSAAELRSVVGAEWIQTYSTFDVYDNLEGKIGNQQSLEEVTARQGSAFLQEEITLPQRWILTLGGSLNLQSYHYFRRSDAPDAQPIRANAAVPFSPRLALLKRFARPVSVYAAFGKGFSPPTVQEFVTGYRPNQPFEPLGAEIGENLEIGTKGKLFGNRLDFDVSVYSMLLRNMLVRRTDADDNEIFINAGKARQSGLEVNFQGQIIPEKWSVYSSYTLNRYRYVAFQVNETDYADNQLPSVPRQVWVTGTDAKLPLNFYVSAQLNFTDKMPLNDANTVFADAYWLLNARLGWKKELKKCILSFFIDGDNLLNQAYSLGNDVNAFGSRFFNPAPPRNGRVGVVLNIR